MHRITYELRVGQGRECKQQVWWKMHQITYKLRVEQGRKSVSSGIFGRCTGSRTSWGWNEAARVSTVGFAEDALDHIQTEGGTRRREHQQQDLGNVHQITYSLREEQGHESISSDICGTCTGSHTPWGWNKAARVSAAGFAEAPDYVLSGGETRPWEHQQWDLQKMHQITYLLRVDQGRGNISSRIYGQCTRSHTSWRWNKAASVSSGFAEDTPDHIQTKGGTKPRECQQRNLWKKIEEHTSELQSLC